MSIKPLFSGCFFKWLSMCLFQCSQVLPLEVTAGLCICARKCSWKREGPITSFFEALPFQLQKAGSNVSHEVIQDLGFFKALVP